MKRAFERTIKSLGALYEFTDELLLENKVSDAARFAVHLALEELFVNMVKYRDAAAGDIDIEIRVSDGRTTAALTEYGVTEFDVTRPRRPVDTTATLADRTPGGLGLSLVHNLVDSLDYQYTDGQSRVIFTKESGI